MGGSTHRSPIQKGFASETGVQGSLAEWCIDSIVDGDWFSIDWFMVNMLP